MTPDQRSDPAHEADPAEPSLESLQLRIARLERDRIVLRNRLAVAEWKNQVLRSRRLWRLGAAVGAFAKQPSHVARLVRDLRPVLSGAAPPPRPVLEEVPAVRQPPPAAADAVEPVAPVTTQEEASAVRGTVLQPLLIAAPVTMSLAPPATSTLGDTRVAAILDEASRLAFDPECRLITFAPHNWSEILERNAPELLLVESAWRGNRGSWEYKIGTFDHPESVGLVDLRAVVAWCRDRGIPTVFWNNEDPVHFERFKEAAGLFDAVYAAADRVVDRHARVSGAADQTAGVLPFGVQPSISDPVGSLQDREPRPLLVASSLDRAEALLDVLASRDPITYLAGEGSRPDATPEPRTRVAGTLGPDSTPQLLRQYRLLLDATAGGGDRTTRLTYAALANGTPAMVFGATGSEVAELVVSVDDSTVPTDLIRSLAATGPEWRGVSIRGIERTFARHTYADRLHRVVTEMGLPIGPVGPVVTAVAAPGSNVTPEELASLSVVDEVLVPADEGRPGAGPIRSVAMGEPADEQTLWCSMGRAASRPWVAIIRRRDDLTALPALAVATRITHAEIYTVAESAATEHRFVAEPGATGPVIMSAAFLARFGNVPLRAEATDWSSARIYAVPLTDA